MNAPTPDEINACAEIVRRGDPERFLAAMAGPPVARSVLFPLYAFNVEVARAPWVTTEPMIAEMRLQWWRDVLDEIAGGGPVRRHEVATPLAKVLDPDGAVLLDALVAARRWDIHRDPHADEPALWSYLDTTAAHLGWVAARALGAPSGEDTVRRVARAAGLVRYLRAVPQLDRQGRVPLVDGAPEAVADLARRALAGWPGRPVRRRVPMPARAALFEAAGTRGRLRKIIGDPAAVAEGRLRVRPLVERLALLRASVTGRL